MIGTKTNSNSSTAKAPGPIKTKAAKSIPGWALSLTCVGWVAAAVFGGMAIETASEVSKLRVSAASTVGGIPLPNVALDTAPQERIDDTVKVLRQIAPEIEVSARGNRVDILGNSLADYGAFLTAVESLEGISPDLRWKIEEMCLGASCPGKPLRARVLGKVVNISQPG